MNKNFNPEKRILLEEKERLINEQNAIEKPDASNSPSEEAGALSDYADHPADTASITAEREKDQIMLANLEALIHKVDRALDKINDGTYGICDRCKSPISPERLEAIPSAAMCLRCQDKEDAF